MLAVYVISYMLMQIQSAKFFCSIFFILLALSLSLSSPLSVYHHIFFTACVALHRHKHNKCKMSSTLETWKRAKKAAATVVYWAQFGLQQFHFPSPLFIWPILSVQVELFSMGISWRAPFVMVLAECEKVKKLRQQTWIPMNFDAIHSERASRRKENGIDEIGEMFVG